jgi:alpha-N-acetylglucosamine transferase
VFFDELVHLEQTYGLGVLGLVVVVVVFQILVWSVVRIYRQVVQPHQEGQKVLANARVSEAKAMSETAISLDSTARELSVAARVQKETAETQRDTTIALGHHIESLTEYRANPRKGDKS